MKKALLTIAVLGTILFSGCEKDEVVAPAQKIVIKADKAVACRGCGDWDVAGTATYDGK